MRRNRLRLLRRSQVGGQFRRYYEHHPVLIFTPRVVYIGSRVFGLKYLLYNSTQVDEGTKGRSLRAIKQCKERTVGWGEETSLLCDPGSELCLGEREREKERERKRKYERRTYTGKEKAEQKRDKL